MVLVGIGVLLVAAVPAGAHHAEAVAHRILVAALRNRVANFNA